MEVAAIFPENKRHHTDCKKGIEFDMEEKGFVEKFYQKVNEEKRLSDRPGQIEYATTMAYIHQYLQPGENCGNRRRNREIFTDFVPGRIPGGSSSAILFWTDDVVGRLGKRAVNG